MAKSDPNSIRAVMSGQAVGPRAVLLRAGLSIVEPFYTAAMRSRNLFYDNGIFRSHSLRRPVIAFGNITTGGTGKTPLVRWAAEQLRYAGIPVGILSRGYGATSENPLGDELTMLSHLLSDGQLAPVPVVANGDRVAGAATLLSETPTLQAILLDDAFQHRRARRDLNIVVINATDPFGFGHVLPRGLLREPLAGLRRADAIVLTHVNRASESEISNLKSHILQHAPAVPIYHSSHRLSLLRFSEGTMPLQALCTTPFFAFCGIGTPAAFHRDVSEFGTAAGFRAYDDHHAYTVGDIEMLEAEAKRRDAKVLLTTEKDWVKIAPLIATRPTIPIWRADMQIAFESNHEASLLQQMLEAIKKGAA